jgi:hypothetical protein
VSPVSLGLGAALAVSLIITLYLGVLPGQVLKYASQSATSLVR